MNGAYYALVNGKNAGPYSARELRRLIKQGALAKSTVVLLPDGRMVAAERLLRRSQSKQAPSTNAPEDEWSPPPVPTKLERHKRWTEFSSRGRTVFHGGWIALTLYILLRLFNWYQEHWRENHSPITVPKPAPHAAPNL